MNEAVLNEWAALEALPRHTLAQLFADPGRLAALAVDLQLPGGSIRFDWSKTHLDADLLAGFERIAAASVQYMVGMVTRRRVNADDSVTP